MQTAEFLSTLGVATLVFLLTGVAWIAWQSLQVPPALLCTLNAQFISLRSFLWQAVHSALFGLAIDPLPDSPLDMLKRWPTPPAWQLSQFP
jgi:hypothetical protein